MSLLAVLVAALPHVMGCATVARAQAEYYNDRGSRAALRHDVDGALVLFVTALRADPEFAPAWYNQGVVALQLNRPRQAVDLFREAIRLDPALAAAHVKLARALMLLNEDDAARAAFEAALALDPALAAAWFGLGVLHERRGATASAAACYLKGLALQPDSDAFLRRLYRLMPTS